MKSIISRYLRSGRLLFCGMSLIVLHINACSLNVPLVVSKLDARTSVTITYIQSPLIFYRDVSDRAAHARDLVYVAPLEVNRSGVYRYYLWFAAWSTMDAVQVDLPQDRLASIEIVADGEPVTLGITSGSLEAIGVSEPVYRKPAAWATEAYYDVSLDQLRRIAEATNLQVQYSSTRETYQPWDEQTSGKAGIVEFLVRSEF